MSTWFNSKNILCIRLDNMGDVLMSTPAMDALKRSFRGNITLLTSSMASSIARFIPAVDHVITFDVPWVKLNTPPAAESILQIVERLKEGRFDAAVIFTVFSQNPLPAALLAYMAGIPLRLAYCRENPYQLLTHWVPEEEPYTYIRHQVRRDLDLVKSIGATVKDERITITVPSHAWKGVYAKLMRDGFDPEKPWLVLHPGVSEKKREYPMEHWIETAKKIVHHLHYQVILTGTGNEQFFIDEMKDQIGKDAFSLAGQLSIDEFIAIIAQAPLVISVNTSTIHIAAATHTPVIVLYALTNPQHAPWKVPGRVLLFDVPEELRSKNEILKYVHENYFQEKIPMVSPDEVFQAVCMLLQEDSDDQLIPEMIALK